MVPFPLDLLGNCIGAVTALNIVGPAAADERIVAVVALNLVVTCAAEDGVCRRTALELIVTRIAVGEKRYVGLARKLQLVVTGTGLGDDHVDVRLRKPDFLFVFAIVADDFYLPLISVIGNLYRIRSIGAENIKRVVLQVGCFGEDWRRQGA